MDNNEKYLRDRATVMATIKYILFAVIIAAMLLFASKIIVIFVPFLIGFVLANASRSMADAIIRAQDRRRKKKNHGKHAYVPAPPTKKPNVIVRFFFPAMGEKRYSQRTRLSILIYVLLLVLVFAGMIWAVGALAVQISNVLSYLKSVTDSMAADNKTLSDLASSAIDNLVSYLSRFFGEGTLESIRSNLNSIVENIGSKAFVVIERIGGSMLSLLGSLPMAIFYVIAVIMSGYYFITDGRSFMNFFATNIKNRQFRMRFMRLLDRLSSTLFRVLGGYMVLLIITYIESWIVYRIAGIQYAAIFAFTTAILDFLPVLGISATMIPLMVYVTAHGNYRALVILIIGMTVMTIIRQVIEPKILGKSLNLHPLATILAMICGVYIWGPLGFLLGPITLIVIIQTMKVFSLDKRMRRFIEGLLHRLGEGENEEDKRNMGKEAKEPDTKDDDRPTLDDVIKETRENIRQRRTTRSSKKKTGTKKPAGKDSVSEAEEEVSSDVDEAASDKPVTES